jgi:hypothetical protein
MWQSPLLPFQLAAQSFMAASGVFLVLSAFVTLPGSLQGALRFIFPASILTNLLLTLAGKFNSFPSEIAMLGFREMTHGRLHNYFWLGGIVLGHLLPLALIITPVAVALPVAVICGLVGLYFYEYAFVQAPQRIPNS